jgi:hypothetical protein
VVFLAGSGGQQLPASSIGTSKLSFAPCMMAGG